MGTNHAATQATDPRAVAELEISRAAEAGAKFDTITGQCCRLEIALRNMARDFSAHMGNDLIAKPNCYLAWLTFAGEPILAEYADEEAATEVQRVWLNGKFIDASPDLFSDVQIAAWADELVAKIDTETLEATA